MAIYVFVLRALDNSKLSKKGVIKAMRSSKDIFLVPKCPII